jgi:hypothetical protein
MDYGLLVSDASKLLHFKYDVASAMAWSAGLLPELCGVLSLTSGSVVVITGLFFPVTTFTSDQVTAERESRQI